MRTETYWVAPSSNQESIEFDIEEWGGQTIVRVWAGDELDPMRMTPDDARKAADEWPAILRRLADKAEGKIS